MNAHSHHLRASRILLSAGLLCALSIPAFAGDGAAKTAAANSPDGNSTPPKPAREKKIYTNEDVETLARNYGASSVGNAAPDASVPPATMRPLTPQLLVTRTPRTPLPPEKDPTWYAQQYLSLSARMDDIDNQVQQLRNFMSRPTRRPPPARRD
jgi:hypothetical protein